jgi:hypothetical protein
MVSEQPTSQDILRELTPKIRETFNVMFDKYFEPKLEQHFDLRMQQWLERIVEKKIEERFAFAIELLHSMSQPEKLPQPMCPNHPDTPGFVFSRAGKIENLCVYCIEAGKSMSKP